ncbi:MAG: hypothetical protein LDL15_08185, partial [Yonghaparkia sp.]|nr:hypothetical protein [Microcella sp.]
SAARRALAGHTCAGSATASADGTSHDGASGLADTNDLTTAFDGGRAAARCGSRCDREGEASEPGLVPEARVSLAAAGGRADSGPAHNDGEPESLDRLRRRIANDLGHEAVVAEQGMTLTV